MEKQDVKVEEKDLNDFIVESVNGAFHIKCLHDIRIIEIERAYPDEAEIRAYINEVNDKLIKEYNEYNALPSKTVTTKVILEHNDLFNKEVKAQPDIYEIGNLSKNSPEKLKEMIVIMLRLSYLQNISIQHDIKILIEETMMLDSDWFINFSKKTNEKIDTYDMTWNVYMVCTCIIPYKFGYINVPYDFKFLNNMSENGKTVPDFFIRLAKEFGFITEEDENNALEYLKNQNITLN